jgi:hypothetical protein
MVTLPREFTSKQLGFAKWRYSHRKLKFSAVNG